MFQDLKHQKQIHMHKFAFYKIIGDLDSPLLLLT